jgi:hypothetical protein
LIPRIIMDLTAPVQFARDIYGIMHYLDRETGKLADCFTLRFACVSSDPVVSVIWRRP